MTSTIMDQFSPNGCSMRSAVPDSHLVSPYPPNDSPPSSFYDHGNTFYLPSSFETSGPNKKSKMGNVFEDSPLNLPDLDSFSPGCWNEVLSTSSSTAASMPSSSPGINAVSLPLFSDILPPNTSSPSNNYLDLSLFCEPGMVTPPSECSSLFPPTLPPTPGSEPLSPSDKQEIEDIVTSFQEDLLPYNCHAILQDSPSSYVSAATIGDDILQLSPIASSIDPLQSVSSATPTLSPVTSPVPPAPSPPPPPSAVVTFTKTKPAANKKQARRKMSITKKKERKKEQNKTAALRYRQKKKEVANSIEERQGELEKKNKELKNEVYCLENEINYLKQLWTEVSVARQKMQ